MGTSAAIIVEGLEQVRVYKHFDGDPDSTLPWLTDFNKTFAEKRGEDESYKFAQLLRSSTRDAKKYDLDDSEYTGWGVMPNVGDCGENFTYILKLDGTVEWHEGSPEQFDSLKLKRAAVF